MAGRRGRIGSCDGFHYLYSQVFHQIHLELNHIVWQAELWNLGRAENQEKKNLMRRKGREIRRSPSELGNGNRKMMLYAKDCSISGILSYVIGPLVFNCASLNANTTPDSCFYYGRLLGFELHWIFETPHMQSTC